jgi:hypothetical protein
MQGGEEYRMTGLKETGRETLAAIAIPGDFLSVAEVDPIGWTEIGAT